MYDFVCNSTYDMNRNATFTLVHLSDTKPHTCTCLKCLLFKCQTISSPDTLPTTLFCRNTCYYHTRSCYIYCYTLFVYIRIPRFQDTKLSLELRFLIPCRFKQRNNEIRLQKCVI